VRFRGNLASSFFHSSVNIMPFDSNSQSVPRLLVLGDLCREEFRLWWEALPETVRQQAVLGPPKRDFLPDFIVLLRSWSGEYSSSDVQTLRREFPLTPILAVQGNWCEGETRNGSPLAGVHSLEWYEFIAVAPLEFRAFAEGWATVWSLPAESQPEHRALFELQRPAFRKPVSSAKPLRFHVESDDFDQFRVLRDFCLRTNWNERETQVFSSWTGNSEGEADFLFFDFPDFNPETVRRFQKVSSLLPEAVRVAFCEFPRPHEWRLLQENGVAGIFPKPFRLVDLEFFVKGERGQ